MKLSKVIALAAMSSGAMVLATYMSACSSPTPTPTTVPGVQPPAKPPGPVTAVQDTMTFGVTDLFLGESDRQGNANASAWKSYGYNLDGKITDKNSTDVCQRYQGAGSNVQVDGVGGTDNSFGANILPIIQNVGQATPSKTISDAVKKGGFTLMFNVTGLAAADTKQTATGLKGQLFAGGVFDPVGMTAPTFTPTTDWPVRPELLVDGTTVAGGSKIKFGDAYVVGGVWVAGSPASITLSLGIGGVSLDLAVNQATITFQHSAADTGDNGVIAGVIDTEALIDGLKKVAGRLSKSLCQGSAFEGIANQIRQTSDILKDGTNVAGTPCNGISIGIGFTSKQIANPTKVAPKAGPSPDPCVADDAGTPDSAVADTSTGG